MGVMAALCAVGTMLIQIPTGGGYVHIGDSMVLLSGILLGPVGGAIAAGFGSGLADVLSGYGVYAPFTLVIKGLMAMASGLVWTMVMKDAKAVGPMILKYIMAVVPSVLILVTGYYLTELVLSDAAYAVSSIIPNTFQGVVGGALGLPVAIALLKANVEKLIHTTGH